jgi:opacity protein-like surface antigen
MPGKLGLPAGTGFAHEGRNREPPVRNILFASILITAIPASASDDTGFYVQGSVQAALWNHVVSEYCHGYDDDSDLMNSEYSGGLTLNLAYRFSNYFELGLANHFMFSSRNTPEFGGWSAFHYKATPRARLLWPLSQNFSLYFFAEAGFVLFKNYWIPPGERDTRAIGFVFGGGAGTEFRLSDNFTFLLEAGYAKNLAPYALSNGRGIDRDEILFNAGVSYRF